MAYVAFDVEIAKPVPDGPDILAHHPGIACAAIAREGDERASILFDPSLSPELFGPETTMTREGALSHPRGARRGRGPRGHAGDLERRGLRFQAPRRRDGPARRLRAPRHGERRHDVPGAVRARPSAVARRRAQGRQPAAEDDRGHAAQRGSRAHQRCRSAAVPGRLESSRRWRPTAPPTRSGPPPSPPCARRAASSPGSARRGGPTRSTCAPAGSRWSSASRSRCRTPAG